MCLWFRYDISFHNNITTNEHIRNCIINKKVIHYMYFRIAHYLNKWNRKILMKSFIITLSIWLWPYYLDVLSSIFGERALRILHNDYVLDCGHNMFHIRKSLKNSPIFAKWYLHSWYSVANFVVFPVFEK